MDYYFELYDRPDPDKPPTLLHSVKETCHIDEIRRRAKHLLWTEALSKRQELVVVRRESDDRIVFKWAIGTRGMRR